MTLTFIIPGKPKAKGRPRVVPGRAFTPKATAAYEGLVALAAQAALPEGWTPLTGPVLLVVLAVQPRPKRLMRRKDPDGLIYSDRRPDLDNLVKAVSDGLDGIAWGDDGQVAVVQAVKTYAERGGLPRVEVWVQALLGPGQPGVTCISWARTALTRMAQARSDHADPLVIDQLASG